MFWVEHALKKDGRERERDDGDGRDGLTVGGRKKKTSRNIPSWWLGWVFFLFLFFCL